MSEFIPLPCDFDWRRVRTGDADWRACPPGELAALLFSLFAVRAFERNLLELKNRNLVHGPVHTSIGQEAVAAGAMAALRRTDEIGGSHRAHHQFLAKAIQVLLPAGSDPAAGVPEDLQRAADCLLAEVMGLAPGCCGGRGGSMHLCDPAIGVIGTNAIVGGGIPLATGAAFAHRYRKEDIVVVSFFGDGAANQGVFHESLNLAGLWRLPVIYCVENNQYAVATAVHEASAVRELSRRAAAYGMKGLVADGMDPLAVRAAVARAAEGARSGAGPCLVELETYRFVHHAGHQPGSSFGYRTREEEAVWQERDPVTVVPQRLRRLGLLDEAGIVRIRAAAEEMIGRAVEYCTEPAAEPEGRRVRPELQPVPATVTRIPGRCEQPAARCLEHEAAVGAPVMKYVDAIAAVIGRWLEQDPAVFVMGEEVGHFGGGAYQATRGLPRRFPGRVIDTPISEAGFTGLCGGAAMAGLRPIVEIMFPDFVLVAADQVFNQIGKLAYMYNGRVTMPLVMRTRIAAGCGYGGQHSADPVALFALFPGWKVVCPATPFDYIGLFNAAMELRSPVLVVEHHELYATSGPVPEGDLDYLVPIGRARRLTEGGQVTVLAYSALVAPAVAAAGELAAEGISAEVIDLRSVSLAEVDYETIGESLRKTGALVIAEQAAWSNSIGATLAYECERRFFDFLDCPTARVAGRDVPHPVSHVLESAVLPCLAEIKECIRLSARRQR